MAVETNLLLAFFNLIPIPAARRRERARRPGAGERRAGPRSSAPVRLHRALCPDAVRGFGQIIVPPTDFFTRLLLL